MITAVPLLRILQQTFSSTAPKVNPFQKIEAELNVLNTAEIESIERSSHLMVFLSYLIKYPSPYQSELFPESLLTELTSECIDLLTKIDSALASSEQTKSVKGTLFKHFRNLRYDIT